MALMDEGRNLPAHRERIVFLLPFARLIRTRPANSALRASNRASFGCCLAQTEATENKLNPVSGEISSF